MPEFLVHLGGLTLGGAGVILLLWATTLPTRSRYAARWRCWGWLLLCLRLAVPLALPALSDRQTAAPIQISVPSDQVLYQPEAPPPVPAAVPALPATVSPSTSPSAAPSPQVKQPAAASAITLSDLLFVLWLAGAAAVMGWNLLGHLRFCRYLRRWSAPVSDPEVCRLFRQLGDQLKLKRLPRLMACQGLSVPMLAGVLRPRLLLPWDLPEEDALRCSLLHELTHFRRRDIPFKALVLWVKALHWFNPAVWLMARSVERDVELACDDSVLRRLSPEDRTVYGKTILQAVAHIDRRPFL